MQEAKVVRLPVLTSLALVAEIGAIAAQATNRVTLPLQLQLPPYVGDPCDIGLFRLRCGDVAHRGANVNNREGNPP